MSVPFQKMIDEREEKNYNEIRSVPAGRPVKT